MQLAQAVHNDDAILHDLHKQEHVQKKNDAALLSGLASMKLSKMNKKIRNAFKKKQEKIKEDDKLLHMFAGEATSKIGRFTPFF